MKSIERKKDNLVKQKRDKGIKNENKETNKRRNTG